MLTLRQIEVIRAIMVTGTVGGAARLLNVSSPGISRVMKHSETVLGFKLFSRKNGRYTPTRESNDIFSQINGVFDKVEDLQFVVDRLRRGTDTSLKIGSVPSISNVMVPRAIADVRRAFPGLTIDVDILKIEEAIDYLLLGRGEVVAVSQKIEHPMLTFAELARGRLFCVTPHDHPLTAFKVVTAAQIVKYPLIGIDPTDPYGRVMSNIFSTRGLSYNVNIRARFGSTVCALVANGLGVAIIDEFTLAGGNWPMLATLELSEATQFQTYIAHRRDVTLSTYCDHFVAALRRHMDAVTASGQPVVKSARVAGPARKK